MRVFLKLHLWFALGGSLVLLVVGVTGCLLVFELSMDRWIDPAVFLAQPQARSVPLAALVQHVQTAFPGKRITQVSWKEEH